MVRLEPGARVNGGGVPGGDLVGWLDGFVSLQVRNKARRCAEQWREAAALRFGLFQAKRACYSGLEPQLIHNNVKSSNVLLDRGG
ncbi:hypothetical protein DVH24_011182 [Malus domestica]|uniref:Protein kinase domain-containing protein n=1 Tax=Malus domestica TaxID=3750 RepID=A0A498JV81_MALDO|nr:hypothetical protein DVH24_011182 [Malus domestica]